MRRLITITGYDEHPELPFTDEDAEDLIKDLNLTGVKVTYDEEEE